MDAQAEKKSGGTSPPAMEATPIRVLLVEDNTGDARLISALLAEASSARFAVSRVGRLSDAQRSLARERFDVALLDLGLPDSSGLETFQTFHRDAPHMPVVVISGNEDEALRLQAVQAGAQDFVAKRGVTGPLLTYSLRYAIERQRTQESLRESEERFRLLVEHAYDGISLCERVEVRDPDGTTHYKRRLVLCNERYVQMSGYTREQLLACDDLAELDINYLTAAEKAANRERFSRGLPYHGVSSWKRPDGKENYSEWVAMPIRLEDKLYTLGIDRDITERRKMENALRQAHEELEAHVEQRTAQLARANEALRAQIADRERAEEALLQSEAQFHDLFNSSPDAIFVEDFDGNVLDVNPAACRLHGLDRAALIGRNVLDLVPPSHRAQVAHDFKKLTNGEWDRCEGFSWTADGRAVPIELRTTCILYRGRPALLLHVRDITERRRAEEALRQAEEKYRGIFENAVVGLSQATPDGRFLTVNGALARMLGYESPAEMLAAITDIARQLYARAEDRDELMRLLQQRGMAQRFETQFVRKDGSKIWVSVHARAVLDANDQIERIEGTVVDITRRKQLEQELQQAQKMEAVGRLAGGVAHDFNNMMMAILGYSEMLLDQLPKDSPHHKEVKEILQAGERAADLTRELLAFSRQQILQPKVINLNEVVLAVSKMLRRLINENIELVIQTADDLGSIKTDPGQFGQVVMNLALNGRDAMPGGGRLVIQTANCALDEAAAQQHVGLNAGDYVTLTVSDTGKGMDPETMAHLFEPFFTTKDRAKGSGLGLSIVYGIIKQSGGHIHVQSEPGRGSTFTIYLPRADQPAEPVALPPPTAPPARGTETILLAEDEDTVRNLVSEVLRRNGYTVLAARDGAEALALAGRQQGPIHLLLTDVVMPGLGGHELAERLARSRPDTKVLYMSGYTDSDIVQQGAGRPGTAFLQKPFTPDALARRIREMLDAPAPQPPGPS